MADEEEREEGPKPGPDPERLKVCEDDWKEAVKKALEKKKPKEGWPKEGD